MHKKNASGKKPEVNYWRGFAELHNDPDFINAREKEFENENQEIFNFNKPEGISRRKFLAYLSASAAFAAAGCSDYRNKGEIVPYNRKPEEITIGNPVYYSSTCNACAYSCGIIINTREGRPVKIDGNPDHPVSKGKICSRGQANILNLYDPERLKEPQFSSDKNNYSNVQWSNADGEIIRQLKSVSSSGKEIAIIAHTITSPTLKKLLDEFTVSFPGTKIYSYELCDDLSNTSAFKKSYNIENTPVIEWNKAKVILSLESDFLATEGNKVEQVRLYTENREIIEKDNFNKLYCVEGGVSLTGLNADYRIKLRTDAIEEFTLCLLNEILIKRKISKYASDSTIINSINNYSLNDFIKKYKLDAGLIKELTDDLLENQGSSYVTAGHKFPESTHIAVNFLNEILGNSKLYSAGNIHQDVIPLTTGNDWDTLINNLNNDKVGAVIHLDSNPVFHFRDDYKYNEHLKKVQLVITMTESITETAFAGNYILPVNHTLESWGDFKTRNGFYSLQQPVISPLYNTRQKEAILLNWISGNPQSFNETIYLNYLKDNWEKKIYPSLNIVTGFKEFWFSALQSGVVSFSEKQNLQLDFAKNAFTDSVKSGKFKPSDNFVLVLLNNHFLGDGRFANNGWLQETPHPVSKIVWDNYAAISPASAAELGLKSNDKIEISVSGKSVQLPVFIQPGVADKVITAELGYGRTRAGKVGENIGVDVSKLISANSLNTNFIYNDIKISKIQGAYKLVSTQEHYPIDNQRYKDIQNKRHIIKEGTLQEFKKNPDFMHEGKKHEDLSSINTEHVYSGVKWAMAIDLNKCTGCAECIVACNIENNIPVVGKEQVDDGREMHWLRIDRYYSGPPEDPKASFQPMLCQHCDFAPCENVCPVSATTHTDDGLNGMTYNRCVGTRYCSNNCPYKVRRFNFFNFRDHFADGYYLGDSMSLSYNPEVTVRSRGVMEKCTFCLQRIMKARQDATAENRDLKGDEVKTACQEACPANAIQFGNMNEKEAAINAFREHNLAYSVLEELKIKPNVSYIAKLRNIKDEKSEG